jgi:hypothetical protein
LRIEATELAVDCHPDVTENTQMSRRELSDEGRDEATTLTVSELRKGRLPGGILLFNEKYQDGHFSAIGSQVWAEAVGERIGLLFRQAQRTTGIITPPGPYCGRAKTDNSAS